MRKPNETDLRAFVAESNRIEGIERDPTDKEVEATHRFLQLPRITIPDLISLVGVYQADAVLRDQRGLDVYVGSHTAPEGGPMIPIYLGHILHDIEKGIHPHITHLRYEWLHPFTDGNGRSGRALWLWQMRVAPLGFLHTFYYQTLERWEADSSEWGQ